MNVSKMIKCKLITTLYLLFILISCDKYDLVRTNPLDYKSKNYSPLLEVTTTPATAISINSASMGGNVISHGGATVTARGVCWSTSQNPSISNNKTSDGTGTGSFTSLITGLTVNTTYYVRAYATNSAGTAYGIQVSFTTLDSKGYQLEYISGNNQTYNGGGIPFPIVFKIKNVNDNVYITDLGAANLSINATASIGYQDAEFNNLQDYCGNGDNACYGAYYYVEPNTGPAYLLTISVTLKKDNQNVSVFTITENITGTLVDIDGNVYKTVTIGTQFWMAANLKTTKYNDGTSITNVTDNVIWAGLTTEAYCWYNNDVVTYKAAYGALYNWYVVDSASNGGKNVCPSGWHVPTDAEWITLANNLGGESVAGGSLKETGTAHWLSPNTGATNQSGFTALANGARYSDLGQFDNISYYGYWWSSTEYSSTNAHYVCLLYNYIILSRDYYIGKKAGFSVRCLKN
jgi:uncharacterized protein (TIGR02145 family)